MRVPESIGWGWVVLSFLVPIVGVAVSIAKFALRQRKTALACLIALLSSTVIGGVVMLPALSKARADARLASCKNNLMQLGLIAMMYGWENEDQVMYPPAKAFFSATAAYQYGPGSLVLFLCPADTEDTGLVEAIEFSEKLSDGDSAIDGRQTRARFSVRPADTESTGSVEVIEVSEKLSEGDSAKDEWYTKTQSIIDKHASYIYLGYAVVTEEDGLVLLDALRTALTEGQDLDSDFRSPSGDSGRETRVIFRLRSNVEDYILADAGSPEELQELRSKIPVFIERPGHHAGGGNVLFLDGHVEFVDSNEFPMTIARELADIYAQEP